MSEAAVPDLSALFIPTGNGIDPDDMVRAALAAADAFTERSTCLVPGCHPGGGVGALAELDLTAKPWRRLMKHNRHIVIRPATPDDIGKVRSLLVATWHDTYDGLLGVERVTETTDRWHALDVLATQSTRPNASFLVALQDDEVVGHAFAVEQDGGVLFLSRLYVLPRAIQF